LQSPMPFGGWLGRDSTLWRRVLFGVQHVSNAFRRVAWEGPFFVPPMDTFVVAMSPMPFGGWLGRDVHDGETITILKRRSPMPFGGWLGRDCIYDPRPPHLRDGLQCLSAGGLGGTRIVQWLRRTPRPVSPMPFGGWLGRDAIHSASFQQE